MNWFIILWFAICPVCGKELAVKSPTQPGDKNVSLTLGPVECPRCEVAIYLKADSVWQVKQSVDSLSTEYRIKLDTTLLPQLRAARKRDWRDILR